MLNALTVQFKIFSAKLINLENVKFCKWSVLVNKKRELLKKFRMKKSFGLKFLSAEFAPWKDAKQKYVQYS